ncbi:MAG: hypothetical protein H6702_16020 [Myxococcales bacterium]|nr:hypothetical protein [Myxococcales bacterium]
MTRPDPRLTPKRPMAAAQRALAYRPADAQPARPLLSPAGALDLGAVHAALEAADVAAEGGRYLDGAPVFVGSVIFDIAAPDADAARRAMARDPRVLEAVRGHVHRAVSRLLGPDTPAALDVELRIAPHGRGLRLTADVEGALEAEAVSASR